MGCLNALRSALGPSYTNLITIYAAFSLSRVISTAFCT